MRRERTADLSSGHGVMGTAEMLLQVKGASKSYGHVRALTGVDFDLGHGEVVALVGDNGAGKSTLVKAIAGTHPLDAGQVFTTGRAIDVSSPQAAAAHGIVTVFQDLALCDNLSVSANIFLGREICAPRSGRVTRKLDEVAMCERADELLATLAVSISDSRLQVGALSGGQRQQVAVARSLLGKPKIVLLDEPTASLGVAQTAQVLVLIKTLRDRGLGVVVISHNLADVFAVADRVFVLRLGRHAATFDAAVTSAEEVVRAITGAESSRAPYRGEDR